jgi:hypothetical protein
MFENDFLQNALKILIPKYPNWYSWSKIDNDGNKISDDKRMQTKYVIVNLEHKGIVTRPSNEEINAKVKELQNAESMRLLRLERNRKLAETDWRASSDLPLSSEWSNYRQALRDLPSTATPTLDDDGNLFNVTWPDKPT